MLRPLWPHALRQYSDRGSTRLVEGCYPEKVCGLRFHKRQAKYLLIPSPLGHSLICFIREWPLMICGNYLPRVLL